MRWTDGGRVVVVVVVMKGGGKVVTEGVRGCNNTVLIASILLVVLQIRVGVGQTHRCAKFQGQRTPKCLHTSPEHSIVL